MYESFLTKFFHKNEPTKTKSLGADLQIGDFPNLGITRMMVAAKDGNLEEFLKSKYNPNSVDKSGISTLMWVATGSGTRYGKKEMITYLIDNGDNPLLKDGHDRYFTDFIKEPDLIEWLNEKYPEIMNDIKMQKDAKKYNL